jgi:hypothetical protein
MKEREEELGLGEFSYVASFGSINSFICLGWVGCCGEGAKIGKVK